VPLAQLGEAEKEKDPVDLLDAIPPCIAPFGQQSCKNLLPADFSR
jgi:hypothetical protein